MANIETKWKQIPIRGW